MSTVLACDLGGSSFRAALIDQTGKTIALHAVSTELAHDKHGLSEIDPQTWWTTFAVCVNALQRADAPAFARIQGIAVCGFTRTQVFLGRHGNVLRPAITWQDSRAEDLVGSLRSLLSPDHPETAQINAFHPLARLHWLQKHEPETLAQLDHIVDPKDYIAFRLTGALHSDPISLARLLAASKEGPDGLTLFKAAGIDETVLPALVHPTSRVGMVQAGLGGPMKDLAGKPVFACSNDTWASVLGLGAMRDGIAYNISGTTEVFGVLSQNRAEAEGLLSVDWNGLHQLGGPGQNGADTVRWLLGVLQPDETAQDIGPALTRLLEAGRDPQPLLFLPYLNGERTPYWDPALRGAFIGLNRNHGPTDLAYAVLEGIAFYNRIILERAEAATGKPVREIRFGGGGADTPAWRQIKADICGRPVVVGQTRETGLLGTAAVVWTGLGYFDTLEAAQLALVRTDARYEPDPRQGIFYDKMFLQFRATEAALSPISSALAAMPSVVSGG